MLLVYIFLILHEKEILQVLHHYNLNLQVIIITLKLNF